MKAFRYAAIDAQGRRRRAIGYAETLLALRDQLLEAGLQPVSIRPSFFQAANRLTLSEGEAARFARDLAQLLDSGLSATQGLGLLSSRETPRVAAFAREVRRRLSGGARLSVAMAAAEGRPVRFLQALARAGEATGRQAQVMTSAAQSLAAADTLRRRLVTLSLYPAFVVLVALGSIGVYAYAVLPALEPAFETMGGDLPVQTRTVLSFGEAVRWAVPALAIVTGLMACGLTLSHALRDWMRDRAAWLLMQEKRSPLRDFIFANLASRLSVMIASGVPLAAAWRLAREPVTVSSISRRLAAQDGRLMEGARLSDALAATAAAPADLIHQVMLGEQSGRLAEALREGARALSARAQETLERRLSVLTPLVIILVGVMVGAITMMVFQGLLAIGDAVDV